MTVAAQSFDRLEWPPGWPRAKGRVRGPFAERSYSTAAWIVQNEIDLLGGTGLKISTNLKIRNDGLPYADQRKPDDPGAAIYFQLDAQPVVFACDQYHSVDANLYAIAKTIEAKRGIVRWGCATGNREFTGYHALPEHVELGRAFDPPIRSILGVPPDAQYEAVKAAHRKWLLQAHPDKSGKEDEFTRRNAAAERLLKELEPL